MGIKGSIALSWSFDQDEKFVLAVVPVGQRQDFPSRESSRDHISAFF